MAMLAALIALTFLDYIGLYHAKGIIEVKRDMDDRLSMGSDNPIRIHILSGYRSGIKYRIIDGIPHMLNMRDFEMRGDLSPAETKVLTYTVHPQERGIYSFGKVYVFVSSAGLGLLERRYRIDESCDVKVYPSLIHMKEVELISISKISVNQGVKKMRRLGHSYEFEQIKTYVQGDDYRSINWKATARNQGLMINQYEDEKSQPIYFVIDKGRNMRMPFNGLSLVDYAVNSTLAISNVALQKSDKVGLLTFDNSLGDYVKAENRSGQLNVLLEKLYDLQLTDLEPDFNSLYQALKSQVRQRSLIFLFTNCNTLHSLKRIKPILNLINKQHLLVVILFENSEISDLALKQPGSLEEIYENTTAEGFIYEQLLIASELNTIGIHTIVSKPEELSINTINKYLELKAKGKA
jgi:uncharacterized protein (DUF58 family)